MSGPGGAGGSALIVGTSGSTTSASTSTAASVGTGGATPDCDGYEPCGVHPVVPPTGYTIQAGVEVTNSSTTTSCTSFADCDMWNTHYTPVWQPCNGCGTIDNGYNRMGSPFPWELSRYIFVVPPKRVAYIKFHMTSPGEDYVYGDGTPEKHTDPQTQTTTCFRRGPGHLESALLGNLGGTGNVGMIDWNISELPGDMGNSGNTSTCHGNGGTTELTITSDEAKAKSVMTQGKYVYCLLREGHDYYLNFMSSGKTNSVDCATDQCTMGGFAVSNPSTSDGGAVVAAVACGG